MLAEICKNLINLFFNSKPIYLMLCKDVCLNQNNIKCYVSLSKMQNCLASKHKSGSN